MLSTRLWTRDSQRNCLEYIQSEETRYSQQSVAARVETLELALMRQGLAGKAPAVVCPRNGQAHVAHVVQ